MTQETAQPSTVRSGDSRVLLFSQRRVGDKAYLTNQYEFEDLIVQVDDTVLLAPETVQRQTASGLSRRLAHRALSPVGVPRRSPPYNRASIQPMTVEGEHDLFFAVISNAWDLAYLHRLKGWRERSSKAVCFLTEVWSNTVEGYADYYALLREFDAVYLFTPASAPALTALGSPAPVFLPMAVDAERYSPAPRPPARTVDAYAYGRTAPDVHQQMLQLVESQGLTYVYDTTRGTAVPKHEEHRALQANLMKRSKYFFAHRINDSPYRNRRTGGEESLSSRYFEGAAGGAIMLGSAPRTPDFAACFDWPDAVIDLPFEGGDLADLLADLDRQPERLAAARAASVSASLLRHDWVHRWERVLTDIGLPVTDAMTARKELLESLAAQVSAASLAEAGQQ